MLQKLIVLEKIKISENVLAPKRKINSEKEGDTMMASEKVERGLG